MRRYRLAEALAAPRVLALALLYLGLVSGLYAVTFFLPQIVKGFGGLTDRQVGLITALPNLAAAIAMVVWTRHSDRTSERPWQVAGPAFLGSIGLIASAFSGAIPSLR